MEKLKIPALYVTLVLLFMIAILGMLHRIGELDLYDFQVYYSAARGLVEDTHLYGSPFGLPTGFYKYSPLTALFFVPVSLLPYPFAMTIQILVIMGLTYVTMLKSSQMVSTHFFPEIKPFQNRLLTLAFVPIAMHIFRELSLGNVNLLLLLLTLLTQDAVLKGKGVLAGVILAFIILTKPYFGILVLPLILYRQWKVIGTATLSMLISPLFLIPFTGFSGVLTLYSEWFQAMMAHSSYLRSPHYIGYYLDHYLGFSQSGVVYFATAISLVLIPVGIFFIKSPKRILSSEGFLMLSWLLYGVVPNLVITDTEHFLASLPVLFFCIYEMIQRKSWWFTSIVVLLIIGFGTNSRYLIGNAGWNLYREIGVLGLANLGFLAMAFLLFLKRYLPKSEIAE